MVGEEAVHADPASYEAMQGDAPVWIVDPVDGTRQFVHGDPGFCTLVALAQRGVVLASWTFAPARDELATAVRGQGAFLDGERLHAGSPGSRAVTCGSPPPTRTTRPTSRSVPCSGCGPRAWHRAPCGSAGLEYLAIARGELDAMAFSWEAAWDHAAGLLLVEEAGGAHLTRRPASRSVSPATTRCRSPRRGTRPRPPGRVGLLSGAVARAHAGAGRGPGAVSASGIS